jgi:hypothetical protein
LLHCYALLYCYALWHCYALLHFCIFAFPRFNFLGLVTHHHPVHQLRGWPGPNSMPASIYMCYARAPPKLTNSQS